MSTATYIICGAALIALVATCLWNFWPFFKKEKGALQEATPPEHSDLGEILAFIEIGYLRKENKRLRAILAELVKGIDIWNAGVQKVIGRKPDYNWPALEEARKEIDNS